MYDVDNNVWVALLSPRSIEALASNFDDGFDDEDDGDAGDDDHSGLAVAKVDWRRGSRFWSNLWWSFHPQSINQIENRNCFIFIP